MYLHRITYVSATLGLFVSCLGPHTAKERERPLAHPQVGLLVMAHGGSSGWNQNIADAVQPLRARLPTAIAFGMADPETLVAGLDSLAQRGVTRVALVRVFVSGDSFLQKTKQLLNLDTDTPPGEGTEPPIPHNFEIVTHNSGLSDWDGLADLVAQRATEVSQHPNQESVLIVAHGQGHKERNRVLLENMRRVAAAVGQAGFHDVFSTALQEDWPEQRRAAEATIREYVSVQITTGKRVIVVPFRLSGFGPYAGVLHGLSYIEANGFLPDAAITRWIENTAAEIACGRNWPNPIRDCSESDRNRRT